MALTDTRTDSPTRGRPLLVLDQLVLWLAAAVTVGALHLLVARSLRLGYSIFRWGWESRDLAWRVPLGYLIVFAPVALVLVLFTLVMGRRWPQRASIWTWLTLIAFSLLLLFPQIHGYASLLLAAGAALSLSRLLVQQPGALRRVAGTVAVAGSALVVAMAIWLPRQRLSEERDSIAALPAAPDGAPNVLLIILDTVRADYMSLYGAAEETSPNLARWASKATVFDQSYSTAPWTTPSHASMFTGKYPSVHGASFTTPLAPHYTTLAEVLQRNGWATGGFTANYIAARYESGLAQGFLRYQDLKNSLEETIKSTTLTQADNFQLFWRAMDLGLGGRIALKRYFSTGFAPLFTEQSHDDKGAEEVRGEFTQWVDSLPTGRPFFAFLNFFDAHAPYRPPEPYYSMFNPTPATKDRYKGGIRYIDDQLDSLFRGLERRGLLENTIVIVTSDHGEQFKEHNHDAHGNSLYRQVLHVPLFVMFPKAVPSGLRVARQVSGVDVAATVLELTEVPQDSAIGGTSFARLWRDSTAVGSEVIAEVDQNSRPILTFRNAMGPMKALFDDTLHVIRDGAGLFEAYAYRSDPTEAIELVAARGDSSAFARLLHASVARHSLVWPAAVVRAMSAPVDTTRDP